MIEPGEAGAKLRERLEGVLGPASSSATSVDDVMEAVHDWLSECGMDADWCFVRLVDLGVVTWANTSRKGRHFGVTIPKENP